MCASGRVAPDGRLTLKRYLRSTISPVAVTSNSAHPQQAKAFVDFLYSDTAQKIFSDNGYRPVVSADATMNFPKPSGLFTIDKFGGWDSVMTKFFDPDNGIVGKIEAGLGVPLSK